MLACSYTDKVVQVSLADNVFFFCCLYTIFQKMHFSKSRFSERPQENYDDVTILHSKSLNRCHKNLENWLTKILCQKIVSNMAFSIVKMSAREVTIFPEKKMKLIIFHLKCSKSKQNCVVCIAEHKTLKIIPQICLIFNLKVFGLPPLHMQKAYSK